MVLWRCVSVRLWSCYCRCPFLENTLARYLFEEVLGILHRCIPIFERQVYVAVRKESQKCEGRETFSFVLENRNVLVVENSLPTRSYGCRNDSKITPFWRRNGPLKSSLRLQKSVQQHCFDDVGIGRLSGLLDPSRSVCIVSLEHRLTWSQASLVRLGGQQPASKQKR